MRVRARRGSERPNLRQHEVRLLVEEWLDLLAVHGGEDARLFGHQEALVDLGLEAVRLLLVRFPAHRRFEPRAEQAEATVEA